jgi:hypothetical protein
MNNDSINTFISTSTTTSTTTTEESTTTSSISSSSINGSSTSRSVVSKFFGQGNLIKKAGNIINKARGREVEDCYSKFFLQEGLYLQSHRIRLLYDFKYPVFRYSIGNCLLVVNKPLVSSNRYSFAHNWLRLESI